MMALEEEQSERGEGEQKGREIYPMKLEAMLLVGTRKKKFVCIFQRKLDLCNYSPTTTHIAPALSA